MRWQRLLEPVGLLAINGAVRWLAFGWEATGAQVKAQPYLLVGLGIWAAFSFGPRGMATLLGATSLLAVGFTAAGVGILAGGIAHDFNNILQGLS